jgi:chemotaxis protein CheD
MDPVRMGELKVSRARDAELVAIGLGSCIGLAIVDRSARVAGLAHIVLPDSQGVNGPAAKFADTAIPEMLACLRSAGANPARCDAVLVGGARMFALSKALDIGARNDAAVRAALASAGIETSAAETGGSRGRTVRVIVGTGEVLVQEAGGQSVTLLGPRSGESRHARPVRTLKLAGAET